ncbi:peptide-N4-(N-acetyl-beta- glucosaminyl)asparagine amidase [Apophysomyces ossiformis]|uniref:Peptide-N4-(N-acetyl-beta-glucosaminyl)asparagine amidase n=1 Tax=Apophysomyces ossiformis TaxID=679940 RepID=A0A8H7ESU6_9FUNG|nr:peptide-N4-(N-acetyl-beta- glucosaminyl)asparagine amidase [Apophysomyces ossiformis]
MATSSSPTSPKSPTLLPEVPPPWYPLLKKSFSRNFSRNEDPVYVSMSNLKRSGEVSTHCLHFQAFLEDDSRFLEFLLAMNDNHLMGDVKSDRYAQICWIMPKSKESYKFKGKFYIASAPIQVTRFPPPKLPSSDLSSVDYWEMERVKQWKSLSNQARAMFTWPSSGEVPKSAPVSFTCQSLQYMVGSQPSDNDKTLQVVHDIAMDNFCLLIYKVTAVEHYNYEMFPPRRTPLLYSEGWKKKLTYCIAFSAEEVVDVTKRYSRGYNEVLNRRILVGETELAQCLTCMTIQNQDGLAEDRKLELRARRAHEETELEEACRRVHVNDEELLGRQSGSLEWRLLRGEYENSTTAVQELVAGYKKDILFSGATEGLRLLGTAKALSIADGRSCIRLTESLPSQCGGIYCKQGVELTAPSTKGFAVEFAFRISGVDGGAALGGADGFAFVMQAQGPDALGNGGCELGYGGIAKSLAIEFDTYNSSDRCADPSGNHISIQGRVPPSVNSAHHNFSLGHTSRIPLMASGEWIYVRIILLIERKSIQVALSQKPDQYLPVLTVEHVDLLQYLKNSSTAWLGFTAIQFELASASPTGGSPHPSPSATGAASPGPTNPPGGGQQQPGANGPSSQHPGTSLSGNATQVNATQSAAANGNPFAGKPTSASFSNDIPPAYLTWKKPIPNQTFPPLYKIGVSNITFEWTVDPQVLKVQPANLTVALANPQKQTYTAAVVPGTATEAYWDLAHLPPGSPLMVGYYTVWVYDQRGPKAFPSPGWLMPDSRLVVAMYSTEAYVGRTDCKF